MASLADRISKPEHTTSNADAAENSIATPALATGTSLSGALENTSSWADEAEDEADNTASTIPAINTESKKDMSNLGKAQTDGAAEVLGGEGGVIEPSYEVEIKLADMQANPNDPLYSIKSFEQLGLDNAIVQGIYQMRFIKPSKIQEKALPLLLKNPPTNFIGQSQSGTGKTAAFVLNLLSRIDLNVKSPQGLVLAPSRELARQIMGVIQIMGQNMKGLEVDASIPSDQQKKNRRISGHIVVGTPGTTTDLIRRRQLDASKVKVLVLDEADNMLDQQGLGDQCHRVRMLLPKQVQLVLFSATFPDQVVAFAGLFAPNANQITLAHEELTVEGIKQLYLDCPSDTDKYDALVKLYGLMTIGSSIIFVRTRATALEIERRLNEEGHSVACLTAQFEGAQRDSIIDSFRSGQNKVLITTNVLSRGIDVQTVSLVINYDLPEEHGTERADPQTYLHRIGRTGRFGRVGVSISLISGRRSKQMVHEIEEYFNIKMTPLPTDDWDEVETIIKKVIKSSRAGKNFNTTNSLNEGMTII